jgi:HK97 family phage portal protein
MPLFKAFRKRIDSTINGRVEAIIQEKASDLSGFQALYTSGADSKALVYPREAYSFYEDIPALATAVDIIAWAFLQIPPVLIEKKSGKILHTADEHPLLKLLAYPGRVNTQATIAYEMMVAFLLCNEVYPVLVGSQSQAPVELYIEKPLYVSPLDGSDGWVEKLTVTSRGGSRDFKRDTDNNPRMWVFNNGNEQIAQFSSTRVGDTFRGDSPLNAIYRNLNLVKYGLTHNVGLLKNGGRPSGMFSPSQGSSMSPALYKSFQNEIRNMFTGFLNAGKMVTAPTPIEYKNFMTSNRDMDFARLLEQSRNEIFSRFGIPLPYISEKVMTLSNLSTASTVVYDSAVLPRARFLYDQLGTFLLPRYKDGDRYTLSINEAQLPALQERLAEKLKTMYETFSFTPNERRAVAGMAGVDKGDVLYQPGNVFPVGQDLDDGDIFGGK